MAVPRVDGAGRISILKHRYHVGRYLAGQRVAVESRDGLLHVAYNGVVMATHARRHLLEQDDGMDRRSVVSRPARPTTGGEVLRRVDSSGSVSFAGCGYRVGNRYRGQTVGVRLVVDTVQITQDESRGATSTTNAALASGSTVPDGGGTWPRRPSRGTGSGDGYR